VADDDPDRTASLVARLHAELAATAELPVERAASRWIGEAEAVAEDAATDGLDPAVRRKRVAHVVDLLAAVEGTGDDRADEHVDQARELAAAVVGDEGGPDADEGGSIADEDGPIADEDGPIADDGGPDTER